MSATCRHTASPTAQRRVAQWLVTASLIAACPAYPAGAAEPAARQAIGSWVLACPRDGACLLRAAHPFVAKGPVTAELDVMARGRWLVPVVAVRGVPQDLLAAAAFAGSAAVTLRFPAAQPAALDCQVSRGVWLCAPGAAAAEAMAARLAEAKTVTVVVSASVSGMNPFPAQSRTLRLEGSPAALSRLRVAGAMPVPMPVEATTLAAPADLLSAVQKLLGQAGYTNAGADLRAWLDKTQGK